MRELDVAQFVETDWSDLITGYALEVLSRSADEITLAGEGFELSINGHVRDGGVSVIYYDTTQVPQVGYFVTEYLVHKRRSQLPPPQSQAELNMVNHLERQLTAAGENLRWAARDILRGEKDWVATYGLPTTTKRVT